MEKYVVQIEDFAKKHYIAKFENKYKKKWEITQNALLNILEHIDNALKTTTAETISINKELVLIKVYFKIAQTNQSKKDSGNRCIVVKEIKTKTVKVLLVYSKNDLKLKGKSETAAWKNKVKETYPKYKDLF